MEEKTIDLQNLNMFKTKYKVGPLGNLDLEVGQEINKSVVVPFNPDFGMWEYWDLLYVVLTQCYFENWY